jgi:hypothetical protein
MVSEDDGTSPRKRRKISLPKAAPYILRPLFDHVPLAADDPSDDVHITCVEYWSKCTYWLRYLNISINCAIDR